MAPLVGRLSNFLGRGGARNQGCFEQGVLDYGNVGGIQSYEPPAAIRRYDSVKGGGGPIN